MPLYRWICPRGRPFWRRRNYLILIFLTGLFALALIRNSMKDNRIIFRQNLIKDICQKKGIEPHIPPKDKLKNIFVEDQHGLLFCNVPRAASSNMRKVLLVLSRKTAAQDPEEISTIDVNSSPMNQYLNTLDQYSDDEVEFRLQNYLKFMFVRNPFERLVSTYYNKFTLKYNTYFQEKYGRQIVKRYRENPSKTSLDHGKDVTFEEFIKYLTDPGVTEPESPLWSPYYRLCHPCLINYDIIGQFETFQADWKYFKYVAGIGHLNFPKPNHLPNFPKTKDIYEAEYGKLNSEIVHKLWEKYSVDFALFGYQYPNIHFPFKLNVNTTSSTTTTTTTPKTTTTTKTTTKSTTKKTTPSTNKTTTKSTTKTSSKLKPTPQPPPNPTQRPSPKNPTLTPTKSPAPVLILNPKK